MGMVAAALMLGATAAHAAGIYSRSCCEKPVTGRVVDPQLPAPPLALPGIKEPPEFKKDEFNVIERPML
jgi:hypothetical protein